MEKINILELLRDCPAGMELDCLLFDGVVFEEINDNDICACPILIRTKEGETWNLTSTGCWDDSPSAKCVIFPKGKTTWEGFQRPFKDGDILAYNTKVGTSIFIHRNKHNEHTYKTSFYVGINSGGVFLRYNKDTLIALCGDCDTRFATEEEKQKLFKAIKDNGYKWNAETKTLDKLIEPSFKVGAKVRHKNNHGVVFTITGIKEDTYICGAAKAFWFDDQDNYELVPDKFDIHTLTPLQPVLVRNTNGQVWTMNFFSHLIDTNKGLQPSIVCMTHSPNQCIPYKGNEFLRGTSDDCKDFYKTWE